MATISPPEKAPQSISELIDFYYQVVKPLYAQVQAINKLPLQMIFEINAAFDHLSRHWKYEQPEADAVGKAYNHLRRACLDGFKIRSMEIADQWERLSRLDLSIIDYGQFEKDAIALFNKIKRETKQARVEEGNTQSEPDRIRSFELWFQTFEDCEEFEKEFFLSEKVDWARTKVKEKDLKEAFWNGVGASIIGGAILAAIFWFGDRVIEFVTLPPVKS